MIVCLHIYLAAGALAVAFLLGFLFCYMVKS
jgi:hypothetical protein